MVRKKKFTLSTTQIILLSFLVTILVGSVTSPVTQVAVVAVKSASIYGTASPLAELIGNAKSPLPTRMVTRKLSNMICVVESVNFFFLTIRFSSKKHKGTNVLCRQLVPLLIIICLYNCNTFFSFCQHLFLRYIFCDYYNLK